MNNDEQAEMLAKLAEAKATLVAIRAESEELMQRLLDALRAATQERAQQ